MPLDTSIYSRMQPEPLQINALLEGIDSAGQRFQQNRLMGLLKAGDYQGASLINPQATEAYRGLQGKIAMDDAWKGAVSPTGEIDQSKLLTTLASTGQGSQIPGLQKTFSETSKAKSEASAASFKDLNDRLTWARQGVSAAQNPDQARNYIMQGVQSGMLTPEQGQQELASIPTDPAQFGAWRKQEEQTLLTAQQRVQAAQTAAQQAETARHNKASEGLTARGQNMLDERARETNQVTREGNTAKRAVDLEMKLADDYRTQSKNFKDVSEAAKRVNSALATASTSPAATLAAATSFMKLLDPGSVVRESELGMALAATGALDRAANYFNTIQRGQVLTPNQVADFRNITNQVFSAAAQAQREVDADYTNRASQYQLNPANIVQDLGQNMNTPKKDENKSKKGVPTHSQSTWEPTNAP